MELRHNKIKFTPSLNVKNKKQKMITLKLFFQKSAYFNFQKHQKLNLNNDERELNN